MEGSVPQMAWSRMKIRGFNPTPRAGCCGVLCGTKWYIAGGGCGKKSMFTFCSITTSKISFFGKSNLSSLLHFIGHTETIIFDILKGEWSVANTSPQSSITANKVSYFLFHHLL